MTLNLRKRIYETVFYTDQFLRKKIIATQNTLARRNLWLCIKSLDVINQKIVFYMIDRYGWPLICDYGTKANMTAFYVVMHSDKQYLSKYYSVLKQAALQEKGNCQYACMVLDRLLLHKKRKQFFGCDGRSLRDENGIMHDYVYPIADFTNVNKRRAHVGLNSIEEYATQCGYILHYDAVIEGRLMRYPEI